MSVENNWEKWLSDNSLTILVVILLFALVSTGGVIWVYLHYFNNHPVSADPAPWGQFGDFFGGTLNPIFGFLSVLALLAALVIQSRELNESVKEMEKSTSALNIQSKAIAHQSFEQTFFSWLENYRDMLDSVEDLIKGQEFTGKRALRIWWRHGLSTDTVIQRIIGKTPDAIQDTYGHIPDDAFQKIAQNSPMLLTEAAFECWGYIYQKQEYQLDSLFRNLYRLILWIDSQHEDRISPSQKWLYVSIVRAQVSWIEMVYLFYNGYTERGIKFKHFVEKYALFDNLNFASDRVLIHLRKFPPEGIIYSDTAYDSRLARKLLRQPESTEETLAMAVV